LHRTFGKGYVLAVMVSGTSGLYISIFASGGIVAALGFALLAVAWLYTTIRAYSSIRNRTISKHREWMTRSYALCFAAVTLRVYLPLSTFLMGIDFIHAYRAIAWLCWIPNLLLAEIIIQKARQSPKRIHTAPDIPPQDWDQK
jgi:uncharacterized membrane protein